MYKIDSKDNIVISSTNSINRNEVFNKVKPNLKDFDYEELLNNCVDYLIQLSLSTAHKVICK